jgi:hypothetical protein
MPWPMSHLYIAENVLKSHTIKIINLPQYYLGSIAPDAVHFRENFDRSLKRVTHLTLGMDKTILDDFVKNGC